jgi:hypothetical protein
MAAYPAGETPKQNGGLARAGSSVYGLATERSSTSSGSFSKHPTLYDTLGVDQDATDRDLEIAYHLAVARALQNDAAVVPASDLSGSATPVHHASANTTNNASSLAAGEASASISSPTTTTPPNNASKDSKGTGNASFNSSVTSQVRRREQLRHAHEAFAVLRDPCSREQYNQLLRGERRKADLLKEALQRCQESRAENGDHDPSPCGPIGPPKKAAVASFNPCSIACAAPCNMMPPLAPVAPRHPNRFRAPDSDEVPPSRFDQHSNASYSPSDAEDELAVEMSEQLGVTVTFAFAMLVIFFLAVCVVWQLLFAGLKLDGYVTWSWDIALIPLWVWATSCLFDLAFYFIAGANQAFMPGRKRREAVHNVMCPEEAARVRAAAKASAQHTSTATPTTVTTAAGTTTTSSSATPATTTTSTSNGQQQQQQPAAPSLSPAFPQEVGEDDEFEDPRSPAVRTITVLVPVLSYLIALFMTGRLIGHPGDPLSPYVPFALVAAAEVTNIVCRLHMVCTSGVRQYLRWDEVIVNAPTFVCAAIMLLKLLAPVARASFAFLLAAHVAGDNDATWFQIFAPIYCLLSGSFVVICSKAYMMISAGQYRSLRFLAAWFVAVLCVVTSVSLFAARNEGYIHLTYLVIFTPAFVVFGGVACTSLTIFVTVGKRKVVESDPHGYAASDYGEGDCNRYDPVAPAVDPYAYRYAPHTPAAAAAAFNYSSFHAPREMTTMTVAHGPNDIVDGTVIGAAAECEDAGDPELNKQHTDDGAAAAC